MADRYRKGEKERVTVHCKVTPETKLALFQVAGEYGIGEAIEQLVIRYGRSLRRRKAQQKFARA